MRITTKQMIDAYLAQSIVKEVDEIQIWVDNFTRRVWFGKQNLQSIVWEWDRRGYRSDVDDLEVLYYSMAGRFMITFRKGEADLTIITAEDEGSGFGIQGINSTKEEAIEMLLQYIDAWGIGGPRLNNCNVEFNHDPNVGII